MAQLGNGPFREEDIFVVTAFQVVEDAEFEAIFKAECQKHGINLFVLSLCLVKLNGAVERDHRPIPGNSMRETSYYSS